MLRNRMLKMFCGHRERDFANLPSYWWTELANGTALYCDHPIQCEAPIAAESDIGGWGVSIRLSYHMFFATDEERSCWRS